MSSYYTHKLKKSKNIESDLDKEKVLSSLSMDIGMEDCIKGFFTYFDHALEQDRECLLEYKELDYIKIKRFLHTAYNNLLDIDHEIQTQQINTLKQKIESYYKLYKNYLQQTQYIKYCFEKIFLEKQTQYKEIEDQIDTNKKELTVLKTSITTHEQTYTNELARLQKLNPKTAEYKNLYKELKTIKSSIVDATHESANIKDINKILVEKAQTFYNFHYTPFAKMFENECNRYEKKILKVINVLAYRFDKLIWKSANDSEAIKVFQMQAGIKKKFNSCTYLEYYINSLDSEKMSEEHKRLQSLLEYMKIKDKRVIAILTDDIQAVQELQQLCLEYKSDSKVIVATRLSTLLRDINTQILTTLIVNPLIKGEDMDKAIKLIKDCGHYLDIAFLCDRIDHKVIQMAKNYQIAAIVPTYKTKKVIQKQIAALLDL